MKKRNTKKELSTNCKYGTKECTGGFYFLGFIGAVIYYLQTSTSFWNGVLGILKAIVWPVFAIYKLLGM